MQHKVLDSGFVELVDFMGGDLQVVNSARISYGKKHKKLEEGDDKLINYLLKHRHGTPFESSVFTFHVKAPIVVVREWHRHRISSFNEISGRYVEMEKDYYIPKISDFREQKGKAGNYTFEPLPSPIADEAAVVYAESCNYAIKAYDGLLAMGVAKEVARMVLPLSLYTEFYYTVNARSLMNFLSLRNDARALLEIREYAKVLEEEFKRKMRHTHDSFISNGRIAP